MTHHFNKLKEFNHRWIDEVVSIAISQESIYNRAEQIFFDDVTIVELFFQPNYLPTKP